MNDLPPLIPPRLRLLSLDSTPDEGYPMRILRAYRIECDLLWQTSGLTPERAILYEEMNKHQVQRAAILDLAIAWLEKQPDPPAPKWVVKDMPDGQRSLVQEEGP